MKMRLYVVDADKRNVQPLRKALRRIKADDERGGQPRPVRDGHGVYLHPGLPHRLANDRRYLLDMCAGGDLGHYAAIWLVQRNLRVYHARQDLTAVPDDRSRRLVAARLDSEYVHVRATRTSTTGSVSV